MRPAQELLKHDRTFEAVGLLARAHALVEENPVTRWPWRIRVGPAYGHVLLALGREEDALAVLEQALEAAVLVRTARLLPFSKVLDSHDTFMGRELMSVEFKRQFLSTAVSDGAPARTIEELVFDQSIGSTEILFTLGRAMSARGKVEALVRLYVEQVAGATAPTPDNVWARLASEHRYFKFGVLLARNGRRPLAEQAFRHAMNLNFARQLDMSAQVPSYTALLAGFGVGRAMLAVWAGLYLSRSQSAGLPAECSQELMELVLQTKGLGTRYAERLNRLLRTSSVPAVLSVRSQLEALEDQMAAIQPSRDGLISFLALSAQYASYFQQVLPDLRMQGLGDVIVAGRTLLPKVRLALGQHAAIGFMVYNKLSTAADGGAGSRYLRYCITELTVQFRDAGARDLVDRAVYGFRRALLAGGDGRPHGSFLAQSLLGDLPESVRDSDHWVIDPDGALTLLPFEALPETGGDPLLLHRMVRYVTSLGQLIREEGAGSATGPACIVANPAYPEPQGDSAQSAGDSADWRLSTGLLAGGSIAVTPLPDTAMEAAAVRRSLTRMELDVETFEGAQATPEALLGLRQPPRILHVASHAVLLDSDAGLTLSAAQHVSGDRIVDLVLPGRRAGLVLAGAQRPSLLLAKDMARLPLQGTQLAVLSGCDTGNGDVDVGEGVASLRRALEQAGAASTITSLWPVPSQPTAELLNEFYLRLSEGLSKSQALQQAKRELRSRGYPVAAWAGFLLAGDDSPLMAGKG